MKRTVLMAALVVALTFAFAASASATTGKFFKGGVDYYTWTNPADGTLPAGTLRVQSGLSALGDNPTNPGVHANYLATTAKCGICHSVHRAAGNGAKLLPTGDATCSGCHAAGTTITAKTITVNVVNKNFLADGSAGPAGGGGGPHNDSAQDLIDDGTWNGVDVAPAASYTIGRRYGCSTRRCHATNPHGANSSKYKLFAAKLLFNNTVAQDDAEYLAETSVVKAGTYGGKDAQYDALGATDASVQRFADNNTGVVQLAGGDILIKKATDVAFRAPDVAEAHALVAGLTCGRPSNPGTGEDECHAEASYAIVDKAIKENRNHATGITNPRGSGDPGYTTDNTGAELLLQGGNDNRDSKTGHVAGTFAAVPGAGSYTPISGCTSCHDQTDSANTAAGNYTFPHGQTPTGITNATAVGGATGTGVRSRIWSGWSGSILDGKTVTDSTSKAYDGQCLKCHRDGAGAGIGLTK